MDEKILRVQMLGKFSVNYGADSIVFNKSASAKSVRLFQILLLAGYRGIGKTELADVLYGWNGQDSSSLRNKNLNKLIYRLRSHLIDRGMPEEDYVVTRGGICYWESSVPVETDFDAFEELVTKGGMCQGKEQIEYYLRANMLYTGELLPMNQPDSWFYERSNYYKDQYVHTVHALELHFRDTGDYKNLSDLYRRIIAIYPFDSWQVGLIRCLLEQDYQEEALAVYNDTMELYAREMGNPPAEELEKCFQSLGVNIGPSHRSIKDVKNWKTMKRDFLGREGNILKIIFGDRNEKGACYCTYPSFVDYCRLFMRSQERQDIKGVMLFLTLTSAGKKGRLEAGEVPELMDVLKHAIGGSLRRGDAYTRYGIRHYILMLANVDWDAIPSIFQRIEGNYKKASGGRGDLWYQMVMTRELSL